MYEIKCPICGKVRKLDHKPKVGIYCSNTCSAKARSSEYDGECIFQPEAIMCDKRECTRCGWNPTVAKERLSKWGIVND